MTIVHEKEDNFDISVVFDYFCTPWLPAISCYLLVLLSTCTGGDCMHGLKANEEIMLICGVLLA
jgi:hypothetical protein